MNFLGKKTPNPNLDLVEEAIPNFVKRFELIEEVLYGGSGQNLITRVDALEKKVAKYMEDSFVNSKNGSVLNTENAVNEEDEENKEDDENNEDEENKEDDVEVVNES